MDSKGGNPFLMDDYPAEVDTKVAQASNPFLQDFGDAVPGATSIPSGAEANPFFSFVADQSYQPPSDSTNPFASFGIEAAVPEPETSVFVNPEVASVPSPATTSNLFDIEPAVTAPTMVQTNLAPITPEPPAVTSSPIKPARPPPPPRPSPPPPPRNTKDLILSVTGAMDETSNQMLDRLQATRTPSPTLMHSPSPTPEHSLADFIDVDSSVPDLIEDSAKSDDQVPAISNAQDILGLFDAPSTQQTVDVTGSFGTETVMSTATDTTTVTGAPLMTSTLSDNPFSDAGLQEIAQPFEADLVQMKRPSLTTGISDITQQVSASGVPGIHSAATDVQQSEAQVASELFGNVSAATPTMQTSNYYSTTQPTDNSTTPVAGAANATFADLLGDFSLEQTRPEADYAISSSIITNDFNTNNYRADDTGNSFVTATQLPQESDDAFDAFASKFDKAAELDSTASPFYDPFTGGAGSGQTAMDTSSDVWGDSVAIAGSEPATGFEEGDGFDSFLSMVAPPPDVPSRRRGSADSDAGPDFSVTIKPKNGEHMSFGEGGPVPVLAPPPRSPLNATYVDSSPRFNPFDKSGGFAQEAVLPTEAALPSEMTRTDSQETPPTPLFDEDISQPLEEFPRTTYTGDGWEMQLRQPVKKKITGQRFWKKVFLKIVNQADSLPVLQLFNSKGDKDPYQELPLLPCYSVSEIAAQQFDQYGKIFTVKVQYIFYKERPGLRPGQVTKAERITNKLSQFAAYAIQGDLQGVKEFGSDVKKLGMPVEHAPQISQLLKLGSQNYEDMKAFSVVFEEALFRLQIHRDRALQYKVEEVQISVVDELYVEQNAEGHIEKQIARVRLFFLGFLSGMPDVELGINDIWRQGKEVVSRHDIIPVATEEWIRLESIEFHACIQQDEYEKSRIIKFKPPDACYIELMRFRIRPPRNRELPLQLKAVMCVTGNKVELRADILVPGFASRKLGRVPCEDVMVRFPIPECWIYLFRVEKHFRYGSVKSAHRRTGKIKGIERFLGAVDTLEPQLMEVTSGQAKYEHQHHAIVWRMPRLPKEGQGAYTTHQLVCRMNLTSYDQIPEKLSEYAYVEFTMPMTQVSHTMARSVSFQNFDSDMPPEKYVKNLSRHEYRVGIEHTQGDGPGAYISATSMSTPKKTIPELSGETHDESANHPASDSDSSD